jgi:DNA polymerase-1
MGTIQNKTLLIVDGHNVCLRAYFGLLRQGLRTRKGVGTWGLYGTINSVSALIRDYQPTHVLITLDNGRSSKRTAILPSYKANRLTNKPDENLEESRHQINLFQEFCWRAGITVVRIQNLEADDVMAKAAKIYQDEFDSIVIVTADHDIRQLVNEKTIVVKPSLGQSRDVKKETFTQERLIEEYGVTPDRLPEIWAIMGDKGDNIPGVPSVGEKTAIKLIQKYGSLEKLLESDEKKIEGHKDTIRTAFSLIQLDGEDDFDFPSLEQLEFNIEEERPDLEEFLVGYELNSIKVKWDNGTLWKPEPQFGRKLFDD